MAATVEENVKYLMEENTVQAATAAGVSTALKDLNDQNNIRAQEYKVLMEKFVEMEDIVKKLREDQKDYKEKDK